MFYRKNPMRNHGFFCEKIEKNEVKKPINATLKSYLTKHTFLLLPLVSDDNI